MISPAGFFWFVNVKKGREEGLRMAKFRSLSKHSRVDIDDAGEVEEQD